MKEAEGVLKETPSAVGGTVKTLGVHAGGRRYGRDQRETSGIRWWNKSFNCWFACWHCYCGRLVRAGPPADGPMGKSAR